MVDFIILAIVAIVCLTVGWYFGYSNGFAEGFKKCKHYEEDDDYYEGW